MRKLILISMILAITVSCQKSRNGDENSQSTDQAQKNFILNNVRIEASTIRNWISNNNLDKIILAFHSADLRSINSNLTLTAFAYEKSSEVPIAEGIVLNIESPASLTLEANVIFSNNTIRMGAIRRAISDATGILDFDYLLLQPRYYHSNGKSHLAYSIRAIKNGEPVKMINEGDECDFSKPSPPAEPSSLDCEPEP